MISGAINQPHQSEDESSYTKRDEAGLAPTTAGLLCYLIGAPYCFPLTGIIFLMIEKDDKDVRFHAWQSVLFTGVYIAILIAIKILSALFGVVASALEDIIAFFFPIVIIAATILWIVCMLKAYQGERWRIPLIGDIAAERARIS